MKRLLFSVLLLAAAAYGDFDAKQWRSRARLTIASEVPVLEFRVNAEIFRHSSAELNDLRIIRDGSREAPYTIRVLAGGVQQSERQAVMLDKSWTSGIGVRAVLDLQGLAEHNRVRIGTSQRNFKQAVVLEASDDAKRWSTILTDGVIFDISRPEARVSDLTVAYPTSTRRYLRITIPGWTDASELEAGWVAEYNESGAVRDSIGGALQPTVTQHPDEQTTDLIFDLGFTGQPCDRLVLRTRPGFFSRSIEVSTGNDGKTFVTRGGSVISRTSKGEHLTVAWSETWDRYIKLTVFNADSEPLDFSGGTASGVRRIVQFPFQRDGAYWVYMGNPHARAPSYDFGRVTEAEAGASEAQVGNAEPNPAFRETLPPYSERKPWVLNLMLVIAVGVMAFVTYRFARKAGSAKG